MNSFIAPDNHIVLLAVVIASATFGIYSEHKRWFGKVSGILITMLSMSVLSMTGFIPSASDPKIKVGIYIMVMDYFIPIAIPLMLINSNIKKIVQESGKLLVAFIIGAIGVVLGSVIAFYLIDLGDGSANTAGIIAATLIGGAINFVATAEILHFSSNPLFTATLAIDNVVANLWILFLFLIPSAGFLAKLFYKPKERSDENIDLNSSKETYHEITLERFALSVFVALGIAATSYVITPLIQTALGIEINLNILINTLLAILVANIFPKKMKFLEHSSYSIGLWMMFVFLAVIGAGTNLQDILHVGFPVLAFYVLIMIVHFLFLLGLAKLFKLDVYEVIISSAANIMGPSVAAPMAASLGKNKLITPGVLVGILGYIIGTFIGVSLALALS